MLCSMQGKVPARWMAVESLSMERYHTHKSDVYVTILVEPYVTFCSLANTDGHMVWFFGKYSLTVCTHTEFVFHY